MRTVHSRADLRAARAELAGPVGLVPTMGALHDGHLALIAAARAACASVIVTVFVNPTQFAPGEDFERYPRTLDADVAACARAGADLLWAPAVQDVYPSGYPDGAGRITIDPGPLGGELEGAVRPGHFAGVLTVVAKLFGLVRPEAAFFGEKDYQQLTLIRAMATDLELPVTVVGVPTVRESDGLARSSRNVYLSADDRPGALALSRALSAGQAAAAGGAAAVLAAARAELDAQPRARVDYLQLRGADLGPAPAHGAARLLVAARVGSTRLIDNIGVQL